VLTRNHRQEGLCRAYAQAVAAVAGVGTSVPVPDYGVDLSLRSIVQRGQRRKDARLQFDLQLRSTTRASLSDGHVIYDLDVATYDLLREETQIRCFLVVLVLPDDEAFWLGQSPAELVIRRCAYWHSLRVAPATGATSSVRVAIPVGQMFTPEAVRSIFDHLIRGEEP
jgi:hypothetical protein